MLAGLAFVPRGAKADITYTWHEDDGLSVTGSFVVSSMAQTAGQIINQYVNSFTFT